MSGPRLGAPIIGDRGASSFTLTNPVKDRIAWFSYVLVCIVFILISENTSFIFRTDAEEFDAIVE
jgi:hypothetical protein